MPPEANAPQGRTPGLLDRSAAAWLALGVSCALTIALAQYVATHLDTRAQDRFMIGTEVARNQLLSRMRAYEQVLRGGAALFAASEHVDRKEWHDYVAALDLDDGLPGIQGIGFLIFRAQGLLLTDQLIVCMVIIGLVGFGIDRLMFLAQRRVLRWKQGFDG